MQEEKFITEDACSKCTSGFNSKFEILFEKVKTVHSMILGLYGLIITALGIMAWEYIKR